MTAKQRTSREEPEVSFESMPFAAMMHKMMGRQWQGCGCAKMMSEMMAMCGGTQGEENEAAAPDVGQKA